MGEQLVSASHGGGRQGEPRRKKQEKQRLRVVQRGQGGRLRGEEWEERDMADAETTEEDTECKEQDADDDGVGDEYRTVGDAVGAGMGRCGEEVGGRRTGGLVSTGHGWGREAQNKYR